MSRSPARRPTLLPSVRRLWRGSHQLQLGTDPGRAVMLELTDPASARMLDLLDGTRTETVLLRETTRLEIPESDVHLILGQLRRAGYVVDAHTLNPTGTGGLGDGARRRIETEAAALALRRNRGDDATPATLLRRRLSARVLVAGGGRLAAAIAEALDAAGVGHLDTESTTAGGAAANASPLRLTRRRVSVAVLVGTSGPAALTALALRGTPHLAVSVRDATVLVGPLVLPGRGPCLNCLDLHRLDRDPAWRILAPQMQDATATEPIAWTTLLAGAALAAEEVLIQLQGGRPHTLGATVEIAGPVETVWRRWTQHPACGCGRRRRTMPPTSGAG
jgi:bacteriocin biosynthesis cyclodehydratase domain-containing protein